ncbi:MAG TPA: MarC family protein [Verrucomicrobia bacterium]|nr:MarC family protein [Verrucomicrobiota bacterium]
MNDMLKDILIATLYFVVLINPVSKVSVLTVLTSGHARSDFTRLTTRASLVAGGILLMAMLFGDVLFRFVFRLELYSLRLAGGSVLCFIGFNALRRGLFFEQDTQTRFEEIALVPLACPMIAGPASIAAAITLHAQEGYLRSGVAIVLAVAINHIVMMFSRQISNLLGRYNVLGALVRLTGLIVMSIGTQMVLDGVSAWLLQTLAKKGA